MLMGPPTASVAAPSTPTDEVSPPISVQLPPTTTVVVYPDWVLAVNEHGDFVMSREATAGGFTEEGQ